MRIFIILLSFGVLLALVQCSSAAPVESSSSELEEDDDVETNAADRYDTLDGSRSMDVSVDSDHSSSDEYGFKRDAARYESDSSSDSDSDSKEFEDQRSFRQTDDSSDDDSRSDDQSDDDE